MEIPDGYLEERLEYLLQVWKDGARAYKIGYHRDLEVPSLEEVLVIWDEVVEDLAAQFPGYSFGMEQLTEEELAPVLARHLWKRHQYNCAPLFHGHFSFVEGHGKKQLRSIPDLVAICEDLHRFISTAKMGSFYTVYAFLRGMMLTYEYCA